MYGDGLTSVSVGQGDLFNLFANTMNPNKSPLNGDFDIAGGGIKFLGFGIEGNLQFDYSLEKLTVNFGFGVPGFRRSGTLFNGQDDFTNDWGNFGTGIGGSFVGLSLGVEVGLDYRTDEFGRTTAVAYGSVDPIFISIDVESDLTDESWVQDGKKVERKKTSSGDVIVQVTDVNTGEVLGRDTFVPHPTGGYVASTSMRGGMTYPAGMVKAGNEMNALDRISHDSYLRSKVQKAQQERERQIAAEAARQRERNRDRQDGGGGVGGTGGNGSSGTSSTATTNGTGYIQGGGNYHTSTYGTGNATRGDTSDNHAHRLGFPIVIDLDDDGVEISPLGGSTARFDYDNDGFKELTAWVGKDDGLLVYDIGNDGQITQTREVVIAEWTADTTDTDLEALKTAFDSNNDGLLNEGDTGWANFKIWNDTDQDGTVYSNRRVRAITPPMSNVPIAALIRANPLDRSLILSGHI